MLAILLILAAWAQDALVGTWTSDEGETIALAADGSASFGGQALRWHTAEGELYIETPTGNAVFAYVVNGRDLMLTNSGTTVAFHPAAAPPAAVPVVEAGLAGRWQSSQVTWILDADGTGRVGKDAFRWSTEPGNIVLSGPNGSVKVPYELHGDILTTTWQGQLYKSVRLVGAAGNWVGSEGSVDPTIAMSYTQYIALYPDGSVGWSNSELTGTRSSPSPGWERFSTSSSTGGGAVGSYGTWSQTNDQLLIQFENGKNMYGRIHGDKVVLQGAGVLDEGAAVEFTRQ